MQTVGPQSFTPGVTTPIVDPAARGGNPSQACQIQNSSSYQLAVNAGRASLSIQPYTAQTVEISGQPITILPIAGTGTGAANITLAFLLGTSQGDGEQLPDGSWIEEPPITDGPLTAAAITAAITGALSTQGAVDVLASGSQTTPPGSTVTSFPIAVATHAYSTLLVVVVPNAQPTVLTLGASRQTPVITAWPTQTQDLDATPWPLFPSVFLLPCAYQVGDTVWLTLELLASRTLTYSVYGLTAELTQQVIAPEAMPLSTAPRGGVTPVTITAAASAASSILALPPNGFSYRLQRIATPDAGPLIITQGSSSALGPAFISVVGNGPNNRPMDDCNGLVVDTNIGCLNGSAATTRVTIWYDLIPTPTLT
jgi:hypothetical protein